MESTLGKITDIIEFVKAVEKYPCLYNHTIPEYACRLEHKRAWDEIASQLDVTGLDCKERWRKIRIAFMRSLKQMKNSNSTTRPYYLYDHLSFLLPFIKLQDIGHPSSPITSEEEPLEIHIENPKTETCISDSEDSFRNADQKNESLHQVFIRPDLKSDGFKIKKRRLDEDIEDNPRKMFLLSLLPEVESLSDDEMRKFRRGVIDCIDDVIEQRNKRL